ncbi:MAG: serine/threonine-protein kinase [Planctomycetota bacterium]|jgi:serine/threonine-protein kinase
MDLERWHRIDAIFHEARHRPVAERAAYLDEACAGDTALRDRIARLLEFDEDDDSSFIELPAVAAIADGAPAALDPLVGRALGPYRLLERVATGGMGVVYRASRDDDLFSFSVAIKLVRRGMDTDDILARFNVERQALASLNHPNIARLLDGGATEDGRPFLVMEYVDGLPVDAYCDEHGLSIAERLDVFGRVCRAVEYAHQRLVIHRDLKPGNILVTRDGVPKLLDFGIAKILDPPGSDRTLERTATAARILTPDYASPEQIRGAAVTTATDVYSLGVVLYGLLSGRRPYRLTSGRPSEIEQAVRDQSPRRPSSAVGVTTSPLLETGTRPSSPEEVARRRATSPDKLRRHIQGDLDNIVMKALAKEPERRYASVEQLLADIDRYREGLPILARKDTILYRGAKFVKRNRLAVASGVLIVASLSVGLVTSARLAHVLALERDAARDAEQRAEHEAEHARIEADSATEVSAHLAEALVIVTARGSDEHAASLMRHLELEVERVRRQFGDQRHLQANLIDAIARVYMHLDQRDRARDLMHEAATIRRAEFGEQSLEYARSLTSHGELAYAEGDYREAEVRFRRALALHRTLGVGVHTDVATAANNLAVALRALGRLEEAEDLHREALALRQAGTDGPLVAESLNNLAGVVMSRGAYADAAELLAEALELRRENLGPDHPLVAQTINNLAVVLRRAGDLDAAEPHYREAIARLREVPSVDELALARTLTGHAEILRTRDRPDEARRALDEALALQDRHGPHPSMATTLIALARLDQATGDVEAAEAHWRRAVALRRDAYPATHALIGRALVGYGSFLVEVGRPAEAEPLLREAIASHRAAEPAGRWRLADDEVEQAERLLRRIDSGAG